jgi:two-component system response regulator AtoC
LNDNSTRFGEYTAIAEDDFSVKRALSMRAREDLTRVRLAQFGRRMVDRVTMQTVQSMISDIESTGAPLEEIREDVGERLSFVAASPIMRRLHGEAKVLAKLDVPILILGESGSGKGVVGRLIHKLSDRSANGFLIVNCSALDPDVLERELFDNKAFMLCNKGTLLLEDIEELPVRAQAKLLCLLQDKQVFWGRENALQLDVRILAATKVNIRTALLQKKLRKELYYCLSAFTLVVPPLRNRKDEIPLLLRHFMNHVAVNYGLPTRAFSPAVLQACQSYSWPGNLRELEKFVKRYLVSGEHGTPAFRGDGEMAPEEMTGADSEPFPSLSDMAASKSLLHSVKKEAERNAITTALEQTKWNRTAAARLLNISYRTLLYKIEHYNMGPRKY